MIRFEKLQDKDGHQAVHLLLPAPALVESRIDRFAISSIRLELELNWSEIEGSGSLT